MIIKNLPDPRLFKKGTPHNLGNAVIYASTSGSYYYPGHTTPYLLVANFKGAGHYKINNSPADIDEKVFYFLNQGDDIEIRFKNFPLETLLVVFSERLIKGMVNYKRQTTKSLLENGDQIRSEIFTMPIIPLEYNGGIRRCLDDLKSPGGPDELEPVLVDLLDSLWLINGDVTCRLETIDARKKATREEIYKRLLTAKHFMHENLHLPLTNEDIARAASLNKFHFMKLFRHFYGVSPHRYIVRLKLERAYTVLAAGGSSVLDACLDVGFESQGTFANLFKRFYGIPPSQVSKGRKRNSQQ